MDKNLLYFGSLRLSTILQFFNSQSNFKHFETNYKGQVFNFNIVAKP